MEYFTHQLDTVASGMATTAAAAILTDKTRAL